MRRGDKVYVSLQVRVPSFLCWRSQCRGAPSHLPHPALLHSTSSASFLPPTAHHVLLSCDRLAQTLNPSCTEASTAPPHTHAQALPRPFTKLRELDMEALAAQVAADVQG